MNLRFYIDPERNEPHIFTHGVSEEEFADVLEQAGEDRKGRENSRIAIGQTDGGRYLKVIYVPDPEPNSLFIFTAYELTAGELKMYKRRRRKKYGR